MKQSIKNAAILSILVFGAGMMFSVLYSSAALDNVCMDFSLTAYVTQPAAECSDAFDTMMFDSTIWLALWAVLCFFMFLIFVEQIVPILEKKQKMKRRRKRRKRKLLKQ